MLVSVRAFRAGILQDRAGCEVTSPDQCVAADSHDVEIRHSRSLKLWGDRAGDGAKIFQLTEEKLVTLADYIALEGVRVNNLQNLNLRVPHDALVVVCGVSGSGKSSLAFDTLYAEGQRRYVETFSAAARQFLDRVERPAVDRITGLPPAVAIHQQARTDASGSTVGTRTEILDILRIFFARFGTPWCPSCRRLVRADTAEAAATAAIQGIPGSRILIGLPVSRATLRDPTVPETWLRHGVTRVLLGGEIRRIDEVKEIPKSENTILVLERLRVAQDQKERIREAISAVYGVSDQCVILSESVPPWSEPNEARIDGQLWYRGVFSKRLLCAGCGFECPDVTPEQLSFTSPLGACVECGGTGERRHEVKRLGAGRGNAGRSPQNAGPTMCSACHGTRLNPFATLVRWNEQTLPGACDLEMVAFSEWFRGAHAGLSESLQQKTLPAFQQAVRRISLMLDCGLGYLSLSRGLRTLSGGEARRTALTSALGSGLTGTLYVLDEPTQGLHPEDTQRVLSVIRRLQQAGNSVVVVEHDPAVMLAADQVLEIGPGAGDDGGRIVFQGTPAQLLQQSTLTAVSLQEYLSNTDHSQGKWGRETDGSLPAAALVSPSTGGRRLREHRRPERWLRLEGIDCHNISNLNLDLPLGVFCVVTGVSGSGKSSLIADALYPELAGRLQPAEARPAAEGKIRSVTGQEHLEQVLLMDQQPIRRTARSIPATWLGVFDEIRILLAETHEAKKRNYSRAMFSFNAKQGGRCPVCEGRGLVTVAMQFLADIETVCEECEGKRFRPEVIDVRYRDRSIHDILNMTSEQAFRFFNGHYRIQTRLNAMRQAGLGYLRLGQSLSTLSGGEVQRLRIAAMLAGVPIEETDTPAGNRKPAKLTQSGRTLFLFDEPSSGLHPHDVDGLIRCLDFLLQTGHSVVVIDHDASLIRHADWVVEMGPGPGSLGGKVVHSAARDQVEHAGG